MKELRIFIDESGDFGEYNRHSPYYIITMVFHNQQEDIQPAGSSTNWLLSSARLISVTNAFTLGRNIFRTLSKLPAGCANKSHISSVFSTLLPNPIFRKVMPSEYKLFQTADLLCTLELIRLKLENNMFSKSEKYFFGNIRDLKKNYIKPLGKKEWK